MHFDEREEGGYRTFAGGDPCGAGEAGVLIGSEWIAVAKLRSSS